MRSLLALVLLTLPASADTIIASDPPPSVIANTVVAPPVVITTPAKPTPSPWHWEGSAGGRFGTFHVGAFDGFGAGVQAELGVRHERWLVIPTASFLSAGNLAAANRAALEGATMPTSDALIWRIGIDARYSVGHWAADKIDGDLWLGGGVGGQYVRWQEGGVLRRPDLAFAIGGQFTSKRASGRKLGVTMAVEVTLARGPEEYANRAPTCAGPCDAATGPLSIDRSIVFTMGCVLGR